MDGGERKMGDCVAGRVDKWRTDRQMEGCIDEVGKIGLLFYLFPFYN